MKKKINHKKILLLTDSGNDVLLNSLDFQRNDNDFEIIEIGLKPQYSDALKTHKPSIILFKESFQAFDYKEALAIFKESNLQALFIVLTENRSREFGLKMLQNGVDDYILKDQPENLQFFIEKTILKFNLQEEKLKSGEQLTDYKQKFQALIEANSEVVTILNIKGEISFISSSSEHLLGFSEKEAVNRKMIDLLNLDHPDVFSEALNYCISNPEKNSTSILIESKNREEKLIWLQISFINQLADSTVEGIIVWLKDVTKKKLSDTKILDNEKKYRTFFENSLDGILLTSVDGNVHGANPAACKMFQMTEKEICEKGRSGLVDLKDPNFYKALKEREETGKTKSEINMLRKDGSSFIAELTSAIIESDKGYASLIIKDNTEKKRFENELEKSEERYKSLFKFNPLPTFVFNENDLSIVDVNISYCVNYGYTRDEFLKMSLKDLRNPTENKKLDGFIRKFRKSNKSSFYSISKHLKKDKSEILVENNSHRFYLGATPYIVCVSNDITKKGENLKKLTDITEKLKVAERIAKIGYWELDLNDDSIYCSNYFLKIYGLEDKDLKPNLEDLLKMIYPADKKKYFEEIKDLLAGLKGNELEFRIVLENGSVKWLHSRSTLVTNCEGQVHCVKGIVKDITSEKLAFEELAMSESRYKGLIQSQTNYFVRIRLDGDYSFCNNKFIEEFGWAFPDNDPVGKSSFTDVMPYDHHKLRETGDECFSNPNINCQMEIDKRTEDGGIKSTLWDMIYLSNEKDSGEMQCVGIDISDRVKVESENKFQANLLNKIGQGIVATDAMDSVTYWNKAAENMYQWKNEEVLGKNISTLLYGDY